MNLNWIRCEGGIWCNFFNLNLNHPHFNNLEGIYIIWRGTPDPAVVYVGQGSIQQRILAHRNEQTINRFGQNSQLFVTWASVPAAHRDGIERYLANTWSPLVGNQHPNVTPIEVNSPWQ